MNKPKSNAERCADYRKKRGPVITLPMPDGTKHALDQLMIWHRFSDQREAIATLIHNLHKAGPIAGRDFFRSLSDKD